jgi:hypothetical protein
MGGRDVWGGRDRESANQGGGARDPERERAGARERRGAFGERSGTSSDQ